MKEKKQIALNAWPEYIGIGNKDRTNIFTLHQDINREIYSFF